MISGLSKVFIILPLLFLSLNSRAQNNYIVSDHILTDMETTTENGYLGIDVNNNLVQLDSSFTYQWGLGNFTGTLIDFSVNPETNKIFTLSLFNKTVHISILDAEGGIIAHKKFTAEGRIYEGRIEAVSDGFVIALLGEFNPDSELKSILLSRVNSSFETIWTNGIHALEERTLNNIEIEINHEKEHILLLAGQIGESEIKANTLTHISFDGEINWSKQFGSDCSLYNDLGELNNGQIVLVGEHWEEEFAGYLKISVCDSNGVLLSTKQQSYSGVDRGSNRAKLAVLSDNRYAVSNLHYQGGGSSHQGKLIFFDNHKPTGVLVYRPFDYLYSNNVNDFKIWGVDENDRILFTSITSDLALIGSDKLMGRLTWGEISCDLGTYSPDHEMYYKKEHSEDIFLKSFDISLDWIEASPPLEPSPFTSTFYCSSNPADGGSTVTEDHLWSDPTDEWPHVCEMTIYDEGAGIKDEPVQINGEIIAYPNPSNGNVTLKGVNNGLVEIFTPDGRLLESYSVKTANPIIDVSQYKGKLLIRIMQNDLNDVNILKIIVQ